MRLPISLVVAFVIGSATTAVYFSWQKPEVASVLSDIHSDADKGTEAKFAQISERLANIESLLAQSNKQSAIQQTSANNSLKPDSKAALDDPTKVADLQAGNAIVERALQSGTISLVDFNAIAASTSKLSNAEREKMLSRIAVAINNDQLRIERE